MRQDLAAGARAHEDRLVDGVCRPTSSSAYLAILDYLREIMRHARLIARRVARSNGSKGDQAILS
jgi:Na+/phosphate symporter